MVRSSWLFRFPLARMMGLTLALVLGTGDRSLWAQSVWFDAAWPMRRSIEVTWDETRGTGEEIAYIEFHTAGHHKPDGSDIRVATAEGRLVARQVLQIGPGDYARVAFDLVKGQRRYFVFFGHPDPPPLPEHLRQVKRGFGLIMEVRELPGNAQVDSFEQIRQTWQRARNVLGTTIIDSPFVGYHPFGDQDRTVTRLTGTIFAPMDGDYLFQINADDRGALYINGQPVLFARLGQHELSRPVRLTRGRHELEFYHANIGGPGPFAVGWQRPDWSRPQVIGREAIGVVPRGVVGSMEERNRTLTADFSAEYLGETFIEGNYSHRYRFTASPPRAGGRLQVEWDFGDGQKAAGESVEHVYLTDGVYPVRVTFRIGNNTDRQTTQFHVRRDYERLAKPPEDPPEVQSRIVATYDVARLPIHGLVSAVLLHERAGDIQAMLPVARRLAEHPHHPNTQAARHALEVVETRLLSEGQLEQALSMYAAVAPQSNLQPHAALRHAGLFLWQKADAPSAVKVLEPHRTADNSQVKRLLGQALVLSGEVDQGRALLEQIATRETTARRLALGGALARSVEYFILHREWEAAETEWERWMTQFPTDFLEGYSLLLRARMMRDAGRPVAAAEVASLFAQAVPNSSYSPQLLDLAWRALEKNDPQRSQALRQALRERYPEDPLSHAP